MKKKMDLFFSKMAIFAFFMFFSLSVQADSLKIIFLYPGGQGSQEQAQPLLDSLSEGIKKSSDGKIEAKITYFSDLNAGTKFIETEKPAAGILSRDLFESKKEAWKLRSIAQTLSLPEGKSSERFYILHQKGHLVENNSAISLISSRNLPLDYVKGIFSGVNIASIQSDTNILGKLRNTGSGKENNFILLDAYEYANISKLSSDWAKNLESLSTSSAVPSAPFVVFEGNIPAESIAPLQETLVKLSQDSAMRETLSTLRLKGFEKSTIK